MLLSLHCLICKIKFKNFVGCIISFSTHIFFGSSLCSYVVGAAPDQAVMSPVMSPVGFVPVPPALANRHCPLLKGLLEGGTSFARDLSSCASCDSSGSLFFWPFKGLLSLL